MENSPEEFAAIRRRTANSITEKLVDLDVMNAEEAQLLAAQWLNDDVTVKAMFAMAAMMAQAADKYRAGVASEESNEGCPCGGSCGCSSEKYTYDVP